MKKSHRKDVIIARIIFAAMCIALIAIIIGVVSLINSHRGGSKADTQTQQTESMEPHRERKMMSLMYGQPLA